MWGVSLPCLVGVRRRTRLATIPSLIITKQAVDEVLLPCGRCLLISFSISSPSSSAKALRNERTEEFFVKLPSDPPSLPGRQEAFSEGSCMTLEIIVLDTPSVSMGILQQTFQPSQRNWGPKCCTLRSIRSVRCAFLSSRVIDRNFLFQCSAILSTELEDAEALATTFTNPNVDISDRLASPLLQPRL